MQQLSGQVNDKLIIVKPKRFGTHLAAGLIVVLLLFIINR